MIKQSEIDKLIQESLYEILKKNNHNEFDTFFTGPESSLESIEIVQIISLIEDKLEKKGYIGLDLLEKVFERDRLNFNQLSKLIEDNFNK
tara:strand:- start:508 stop:777 length:270 start_codon:yes stop_codon:yes gene_type:complete